MSKTNATGIHPFELLDHFGVDSYRYYFMREIQFGAGRQLLVGVDGRAPQRRPRERARQPREPGPGDARAPTSTARSPRPRIEGAEADLPTVIEDAVRALRRAHGRSSSRRRWPPAVWEIVDAGEPVPGREGAVEDRKDEARREELAGILYASAETLRILAVLISPIMPARRGASCGSSSASTSRSRPSASREAADGAAWPPGPRPRRARRCSRGSTPSEGSRTRFTCDSLLDSSVAPEPSEGQASHVKPPVSTPGRGTAIVAPG